jgi:hypothetical protein
MQLIAPIAALVLSACVVGPAGYGSGVMVAPPLPLVVELGVDGFYFQSGFYYFYDNNTWRYASSRSGPWSDLPRSHYPRETRFQHRPDDRGGQRDHDRPDRRP